VEGPYNLEKSAQGVEAIRAITSGRGRVLILMQNNPDADAIASAAALRHLIKVFTGKQAVLGYTGICGRAENEAMLQVLRIVAHRITPEELYRYRILCLVDTQPGFGNNPLFTSRPADIVIDHHLGGRRNQWQATWADVRPTYGSAATIMFEYCRVAGVSLSANLSTALFYGIQSDTSSLGREAGPADSAAYLELFASIDQKKLARIRRAPVNRDYFRMLHASLETCETAGGLVLATIRTCSNPDMIAEVADLLLRLEGSRTAICMGFYGDRILLSVRCADARDNASGGAKRIVKGLGTGGGHRTMAGGQVPFDGDREELLRELRLRAIRVFAKNHHPKVLVT
jgi:nanoRNase/pAp phosphatase (c-di-AMP/oligoRNAs hydrolase)